MHLSKFLSSPLARKRTRIHKTAAALLATTLPMAALSLPSLTVFAAEESSLESVEETSESEAATGYQIGDKMADFSVTTPDGETLTLSELLKTHNTVVLNLWFAGCGPCADEFPFLEEAYEKYSDQVAVVALTPYDEDDVITEYKEEKGLTFPMAKDTAGLSDLFSIDGFPTTIIIDRFGTICFLETGSQPSSYAFESMFEAFSADDYTESLLDFTVPRQKPTCTMPDASEVSESLNIEDGTLTFSADETDEYSWPWLLDTEEIDGVERTYAYSSNADIPDSYANLCTHVSAKAGDALSFDYKISCGSVYDYFSLTVNDSTVKVFTGERDWSSYAYRFDEDGEYDITFSFNKSDMEGDGTDQAAIDNVALLSGDAADEAVLSNPVYPTASQEDAAILAPASDEFKELAFYDKEDDSASDDLTDALSLIFGDNTSFYLCNAKTADFSVLLGSNYDPDAAIIYSIFDNSASVLTSLDFDDDGFKYSTEIDSTPTTGYTWTLISLYPNFMSDSYDSQNVVVFASEEEINSFVQNEIVDEDENPIENVKWKYADGTLPSTDALPEADDESENAEVSYQLIFTDQDGTAVAGVIANVCDEDTCQPRVADDNGIIEFDAAPYPYAIHVLSVPDGYEFDTSQEFTAPEDGGEMSFTITKK